MNITKVSTENCTACCLCQNVCPANAISMSENQEGFLYPHIDFSKCVECGKCLQYCPVENPEYHNEKNPVCHAINANDEIRKSAASGGIFSAFAELLVRNGGIVYGAAYNDDFSVEFKSAENLQELEALKGSKYVQSNANDVYKKVKESLLQEKRVLFGGCPCQVAALYKFLGDSGTQNLYTMDIVCHGVPSPKVLRKYLKENFADKKISKIDFRDKTVYGWSTETNIYFENGTVYRRLHTEDPFWKAFLPCICLRKSCSNCKFSVLPRQGDLTIGDFWGIDHFDKSIDDRKGTSVVLVNSEKGRNILEECSEYWSKDIITPIDEALRINKTIAHPFHAHPARRRFFANLDRYSLDILVQKCQTHHYDIGIVGLWYGLNYGSILTYYALYQVVNEMGFDALMVNKPKELWSDRYTDHNTIANKFIYENCYVSNIRKNKRDWEDLNNHCDAFIVGSDVVWNYAICGKQSHQFFFLDFVDDKKKKIAMASSFGAGYNAPDDERILDKYYISKFDYIGVRETDGIDICDSFFDVKADQVVDPVFICNKTVFTGLANKVQIQNNSPFVSAYILGASKKKLDIVRKISTIKNCEMKIIENPNDPGVFNKIVGVEALNTPTVEEWLFYIKNCDFFVGDSFHGLCFALIFNKQFLVAIDSNISGLQRFTTLLEMVGLENRLFYTDRDDINKIDEIANQKIDYTIVNRIIEKHAKDSYEWLLNAIKGEKRYTMTAYDILLKRLDERIGDLENR